MKISIEQAVQYAKNAGFSGTSLAIIVAIAQAESGLDTTQVNPNDPNGGSFGILQINGIHGQPTSVTFDPQKSFDYAFELSKGGTDFTPWSTFTQTVNNYKNTPAWKQLSGDTTPGNNPILDNLQSSTTQPPGWLCFLFPILCTAPGDQLNPNGTGVQLPGNLQALWDWISNPTRIIKLVAGLGLILTSVLLLVNGGDVQQTAQKAGKALGVL